MSKKVIYWNPWVGCHMLSESCIHCNVFEDNFLKTGSFVCDVKYNDYDFNTVVKIHKENKQYVVEPGSIIIVCDNSDYFIEDADKYRKFTWEMIKERSDCLFIIYTRRIQRFNEKLPADWGDGYSNVVIGISLSSKQDLIRYGDDILNIKCKHRCLRISPITNSFDIKGLLSTGKIDFVTCEGEISKSQKFRNTVESKYSFLLNKESYIGFKELRGKTRVCRLSDVTDISLQCKLYDVTFRFFSVGSVFKDGTSMVSSVALNDEGYKSFKDRANKCNLNNGDLFKTYDSILNDNELTDAVNLAKLQKL